MSVDIRSIGDYWVLMEVDGVAGVREGFEGSDYVAALASLASWSLPTQKPPSLGIADARVMGYWRFGRLQGCLAGSTSPVQCPERTILTYDFDGRPLASAPSRARSRRAVAAQLRQRRGPRDGGGPGSVPLPMRRLRTRTRCVSGGRRLMLWPAGGPAVGCGGCTVQSVGGPGARSARPLRILPHPALLITTARDGGRPTGHFPPPTSRSPPVTRCGCGQLKGLRLPNTEGVMTPVGRLVYDDAPWLSTSVQVQRRRRWW